MTSEAVEAKLYINKVKVGLNDLRRRGASEVFEVNVIFVIHVLLQWISYLFQFCNKSQNVSREHLWVKERPSSRVT